MNKIVYVGMAILLALNIFLTVMVFVPEDSETDTSEIEKDITTIKKELSQTGGNVAIIKRDLSQTQTDLKESVELSGEIWENQADINEGFISLLEIDAEKWNEQIEANEAMLKSIRVIGEMLQLHQDVLEAIAGLY